MTLFSSAKAGELAPQLMSTHLSHTLSRCAHRLVEAAIRREVVRQEHEEARERLRERVPVEKQEIVVEPKRYALVATPDSDQSFTKQSEVHLWERARSDGISGLKASRQPARALEFWSTRMRSAPSS